MNHFKKKKNIKNYKNINQASSHKIFLTYINDLNRAYMIDLNLKIKLAPIKTKKH